MQSDFGPPPKRRIATYGKAFRNRSAASPSPSAASKGASAALTASTPLPQPESRWGDTSASRQKADADKARPQQQAQTLRAQPRSDQRAKPDGIRRDGSRDDDNMRAKKRKLTPLRDTEASALYDVPSSPESTPKVEKSFARRLPLKTFAATQSKILSSHPPPAPPRDIAMRDAPQGPAPFSPSVVKAMDTLSVEGEKKKKPAQHRIPLRPTPKVLVTIPVSTAKEQQTARLAESKVATKRSLKPARRRLVDVLAEQAESSPDESEAENPALSQSTEPNTQRGSPAVGDTASEPAGSSPAPSTFETSIPRALARPTAIPKRSGPKFTYSQSRTMLAEGPLLDNTASGAADDFELQMSQPLLPPEPDVFDEGLEDDPNAKGAIRSLHELRQAGANNRFADEMDDILDRVGSPTAKPSSTRRNALLELAQKIPEKSFRQQFKNHSASWTLFNHLDKEHDVVAAFAIVSILVTLLSTATPTHLVGQLRAEGVAQLFAVLLVEKADITRICKDRKTNMSRIAQSTVSTLKSAMLQHSEWGAVQPSSLSPRTLVLKCMELFLRQSAGSDIEDVLTPPITEQLFTILAAASETAFWESPEDDISVDVSVALALLETQAVRAMRSHPRTRWTHNYLPIVADVLAMALKHRSDRLNHLECSILKLTLNVANNNPEATNLFVDKGLLLDLAQVVRRTFETVLKSITDDAFVSGVLDTLVLMLGVMINFSEDDPSAGRTLHDDQGDATPALDGLIKLFLDHHAVTSEADSVEKSHLNVAFGYLSILLGYLSLYGPIRDRIGMLHPGGNLEPLLESIREFLVFHKAADYALANGEGVPGPHADFTDRLQSLLESLERSY